MSEDARANEALREWLVTHLALDDGPIETTLISGGASNLTIGVRIGDRELVVRRPPKGAFLPTANDVSREYRYLHALGPTPVPTPTVFAYCDDADVIGAPFYVMQHLHGVVPHEPATLDGLTEADGRA